MFLRPTSSSTSRPARTFVSYSILNKNEKCKQETCSKFPHDFRNAKQNNYSSKINRNFNVPILNPKNLINFNLKIL